MTAATCIGYNTGSYLLAGAHMLMMSEEGKNEIAFLVGYGLEIAGQIA